jgi:AcrR family transcriptional regulator
MAVTVAANDATTALAEAPARELRRDALARRERILAAAVELFRSEGLEVPLEKIADRAGVGRATLYRNFPDREALLDATLQVRMGELAEQVRQWSGRSDAFFLAVRAQATFGLNASCFDFIVTLHRRDPKFTKRVREGFEGILAEPLARAKAAGLIREDFDPADVYLLVLMTAAGGLEEISGDISAGFTRALDLLAHGYAPQRQQNL